MEGYEDVEDVEGYETQAMEVRSRKSEVKRQVGKKSR